MRARRTNEKLVSNPRRSARSRLNLRETLNQRTRLLKTLARSLSSVALRRFLPTAPHNAADRIPIFLLAGSQLDQRCDEPRLRLARRVLRSRRDRCRRRLGRMVRSSFSHVNHPTALRSWPTRVLTTIHHNGRIQNGLGLHDRERTHSRRSALSSSSRRTAPDAGSEIRVAVFHIRSAPPSPPEASENASTENRRPRRKLPAPAELE